MAYQIEPSVMWGIILLVGMMAAVALGFFLNRICGKEKKTEEFDELKEYTEDAQEERKGSAEARKVALCKERKYKYKKERIEAEERAAKYQKLYDDLS